MITQPFDIYSALYYNMLCNWFLNVYKKRNIFFLLVFHQQPYQFGYSEANPKTGNEYKQEVGVDSRWIDEIWREIVKQYPLSWQAVEITILFEPII